MEAGGEQDQPRAGAAPAGFAGLAGCLYVSLPALLECNPFQNECRESWRASPPLPEELRRVVLIYQAALDLLRQYEVHPEITSQMFAYLFFFSNTLLFNQLLDKGQSSSNTRPGAEVLEVSESPATALGNLITQEDFCSLGGCAEPEAEGPPPLRLVTNGCPYKPPAGEPQLQDRLKQLQLGRGPAPKAGTAPTDPSCLLTPPTTPLNFDSGSPESPQGTGKGLQDPRRNGMNGTKGSTPEGCSPTPYDYPTPESSSRSSATDDFCYVFVVELERGPIGLGMGLIDGLGKTDFHQDTSALLLCEATLTPTGPGGATPAGTVNNSSLLPPSRPYQALSNGPGPHRAPGDSLGFESSRSGGLIVLHGA
ncbi:ras-associating and dilute domain-containing protein [Limosa lapponica baueri]|uniref:Ras-associating and dilute domain-containing protein n=1 Tax=Limosa lapponica baueri TaxID=1758121 RepID=A0A2I0TAA9_LIMLA|nr:ras-associating and dilute domain-containing protein [Limosa lapponica baueri]